MQLSKLILASWATSATAIDIWFWDQRGCGGASSVCRAINPRVCCLGGYPGIDRSVSFLGIPTSWSITCQSSFDLNCRDPKVTTSVHGNTWTCHDNDDWFYDSAQYWFNGKKKRDDVCSTSEGPCDALSAQRADAMVLRDGTLYEVGGLSDEKWKEIHAFGINATSSSDIPAEFQSLKSETKLTY